MVETKTYTFFYDIHDASGLGSSSLCATFFRRVSGGARFFKFCFSPLCTGSLLLTPRGLSFLSRFTLCHLMLRSASVGFFVPTTAFHILFFRKICLWFFLYFSWFRKKTLYTCLLPYAYFLLSSFYPGNTVLPVFFRRPF